MRTSKNLFQRDYFTAPWFKYRLMVRCCGTLSPFGPAQSLHCKNEGYYGARSCWTGFMFFWISASALLTVEEPQHRTRATTDRNHPIHSSVPCEGKRNPSRTQVLQTWLVAAMQSRPEMFRRSTDTCSHHGLLLQQANVVRFLTAGERKMSSTKGHQLLTWVGRMFVSSLPAFTLSSMKRGHVVFICCETRSWIWALLMNNQWIWFCWTRLFRQEPFKWLSPV